MGMKKQWIQAATVAIDEDTGALIVKLIGVEFPNIDIGDVNLLNKAGAQIDPAEKGEAGTAATAIVTGIAGAAPKTIKDLFDQLQQVKQVALAQVGGGRKTVAAHGVPEALSATPLACRMVLVTPIRNNAGEGTNTEVILVGNATARILRVGPNSGGYYYMAADVANVQIDSLVNGEGVDWVAFN